MKMKAKPNKNKFHAVRCEFDGITFDSLKEMRFYASLKQQMMLSVEEFRVIDIQRQVRYDIAVAGKKIAYYKLDFLVTYGNGTKRYFDVKGVKKGCAYQLFKLKKKIVEAIYNINIEEV